MPNSTSMRKKKQPGNRPLQKLMETLIYTLKTFMLFVALFIFFYDYFPGWG